MASPSHKMGGKPFPLQPKGPWHRQGFVVLCMMNIQMAAKLTVGACAKRGLAPRHPKVKLVGISLREL